MSAQVKPENIDPPDAALPLLGAAGKRFTLVYPDPLGSDEPNEIQVTVAGQIEAHGWITPGGGWTAPSLGNPERGDVYSWRVPVRTKRKRRAFYLRVNNLLEARRGWKS